MSMGRRGAEATRPLREGQLSGIGSGVRGAPQILSGATTLSFFAGDANDTGVVTNACSIPGREGKGPLLPVAPLVSALRRDLEGRSRERALGLNSLGAAAARLIKRAVTRDGFTVQGADELCVRYLDRHPIEVYGDEWLVGT